MIFLMALYSNDVGKALTNRYGREVVVANAAMHFFVLFTMSGQFRTATKALFCRSVLNAQKVASGERVAPQATQSARTIRMTSGKGNEYSSPL